MATHLQNKISVDVAADNSSVDSLSFAGLVAIQDQQSKSPPTISANQIKKTQKFEFWHTGPDLTATDPIKYSPADLLISNGHNESHVTIQSSQGSLPGTRRSSSRRSGDNKGGTNISDKPNHKVRNQANKERTAASSWFGQKLFQSFLSPCRQCRAVTPTVKAHTVPGENLKIH